MPKSKSKSSRKQEAGEAEQPSSHLDLPLLPHNIFDVEIQTYLDKLSDEQWKTVEERYFEPEVVQIISEMMETLLDKYVQTVKRQTLAQEDSHSTNENIGEPLQDEGSCSRDIFHSCFGKVLGTVQPKYFYLDHLTKRFIEIIERKEHMSPVPTMWSAFHENLDPNSPKTFLDLIYDAINILSKCLETRTKLMQYQKSEDKSNESDDNCTENAQSTAEARREKSETESSESDLSETAPTKSENSYELLDPLTLIEEQMHIRIDRRKRHEENFVADFLTELIKYTAYITRSDTRDVDFNGILSNLLKMTAGKLGPTLPKCVNSIVKHVYRRLVKKYGSKLMVQSVMEYRQAKFEENLAKFLIEEMNQPKGTRKVKICIEKKDQNSDDKSPSSSSKIMTMFRSMAKAVRNLFSCKIIIEFSQ